MSDDSFDVVTGAFGYTGRYITRGLLAAGRRVKTLTAHPDRPHPFGNQIETMPFSFDDRARLTEQLRGADALINTYWIRFAHRGFTFDRAVANTNTLIRAACEAGVKRFVHVSITNPSIDSPLPYFRGKAILERTIKASGLSHAILRPTVVFGLEDILVNNIAYLVRRFPVFFVPGDGAYRVQPIFVEDLAALAVKAARGERHTTIDAVGPEVLPFRAFVGEIRKAVGGKARIVGFPPWATLAVARVIGLFFGDVTLTQDEVKGLMANLLVSSEPPTGPTRFTDWIREHAHALGARYASELARHYR